MGHTGTQGGSSQCRQLLGKWTVSVSGKVPTSKVWTRLKKVPVGVGVIGVLVGQGSRPAGGIPLLAGGHAGMAADADIQIDDQGQLGHGRILLIGVAAQR